MYSRLSNKNITNLALSPSIVDNTPRTQIILSTIAKSGIAKPIIYEGWVLAGSQERTDENCGKFMTLGCLNPHDDNLLKYQMPLKKRNAFIKSFKRNCNELGCNVCYVKAGVNRSIEIKKRFDLYSKVYHKKYISHVIVSPESDTELDYVTMRKEVNKRLKELGFVAWVLIPHHFRVCRDSQDFSTVSKDTRLVSNVGVKEEPVLVDNPPVSNRGFDKLGIHFHAVGFGWIDGKKQGRIFHKSKVKMIVKNTNNKNRNLQKTLSYLLSHCSKHKDNKFHSITYNGKLGYSNRLLGKKNYVYTLDGELKKIDSEETEEETNYNKCPICRERLKRVEYVGIDRPPDIEESYLDKSNNWKYAKEKYNPASIYYYN